MDILKIDVEGSELAVLTGAEEILAKLKTRRKLRRPTQRLLNIDHELDQLTPK